MLVLGLTLMNLIFTILHLPKDLIPSFLFFIFVYKGMEQIQECSVFIKARKETMIAMVLTGIAWVGHLLQTAKAFLRGTSTGRAGGFRNQ